MLIVVRASLIFILQPYVYLRKSCPHFPSSISTTHWNWSFRISSCLLCILMTDSKWTLHNEHYCNAVMAGSPRWTTDKLQRVMNSATRIVSNTLKFDSTLSWLLHDELHWLDVTDRVRFKLAVLIYIGLFIEPVSYTHLTLPTKRIV